MARPMRAGVVTVGPRCPAADEQIDDRVGFGDERVLAAAEDPVGRHLVERAEEHLGRQRRVDARCGRRRVACPSAIDVADDAEVLAQVGRGEALHELRRLPQLDLEDDGQVAVAAEAVEVQPGDLAQALDADRRVAATLSRPVGDRLLHRALEDRDEQVVLAAEVEIDRAGGDAGGAGDVGDLGVEEAARGEGVDGGAEDARRACRAVGRGSAARRAAAWRPAAMNECSFSGRRQSSRKP